MNSKPSPWTAVSNQTFVLGESPFWHPQEHTLYWVDIAGRKLARANVYMGTVETWDMPSEPGCIAPAANGGLVIALRHGVFRARTWGGELVHIATLDYDQTTVRANRSIERAVAAVLAEGNVRTPDLGGASTTQQMTEAVIARLG